MTDVQIVKQKENQEQGVRTGNSQEDDKQKRMQTRVEKKQRYSLYEKWFYNLLLLHTLFTTKKSL
jgi:hypothetical protein